MAGEEEGQNTESDAGYSEPDAALPPPPIPPGNGIEVAEHGPNHRKKGEPKRRWLPRDIKPAEWIMIAFTAITAFASWAGVYVAGGQLREMRDSSADTHTLAVSTNNLATAAQGQEIDTNSLAEATRNLLGAGRDQVAALRSEAQAGARQADAAVTAGKATDRLARSGQAQAGGVLQSLDISRQANEIAATASAAADRPWIAIEMPPANPAFAPRAGTAFIVPVVIQNMGRSPATNTRVSGLIEIYKYAPNAHLGDLPPCENCQQSIVFPSNSFTSVDGFTYRPELPPGMLTDEEVERISSRTDIIVMRGRVDYSDQSGKSHSTFLCAYWLTSLQGTGAGAFIACGTGNRAT